MGRPRVTPAIPAETVANLLGLTRSQKPGFIAAVNDGCFSDSEWEDDWHDYVGV